jgi:hypothetical protein
MLQIIQSDLKIFSSIESGNPKPSHMNVVGSWIRREKIPSTDLRIVIHNSCQVTMVIEASALGYIA